MSPLRETITRITLGWAYLAACFALFEFWLQGPQGMQLFGLILAALYAVLVVFDASTRRRSDYFD